MAQTLKATLTFSDEQSMLLDTAAEFFQDKSPIAHVREQLTTEHGFEAAHWDEMVALGWSGLAIGEDYGGSGLGLGAAVTIAEPMGRHLAASPFISTQLFVAGLQAGSEGQQSKHLAAIAEGAIGTVALFEEDGDWNLAKAQCELANGCLTGVKTFVTDAGVADYLLVSAQTTSQEKRGPVLAILEKAALPTNALVREGVIDETRRSFRINLDQVAVDEHNLIRGDAAQRALSSIRNAALLLIAAESSGGIAGVLDLVVEYLNTREAFGRKIGAYQGLKHPTVDILIGLERSRSHVYHAASLIDAGQDPEVAVRMAKAEASDSFAFAGDRAIQFHGGFGFTYECDAQLYLRRALWSQYAFGDAAHHRKHLAELLL